MSEKCLHKCLAMIYLLCHIKDTKGWFKLKKTVYEEMRENRNRSQQHVANAMNLSLTAYRNKEKGRSRFYVDEVIEFLNALGVDDKDEMKKLGHIIFFGNEVSERRHESD